LPDNIGDEPLVVIEGRKSDVGGTVVNRNLFGIQNFGQTEFVVSAAGKVGIGTTTPSALLDVNGTVKAARFLTESQDSGVTLTASDFGKTITVDSVSDQIVNFPSVDSGDIGCWFTIVKLGSGRMTIDAADTDTIADSGEGLTIYNNTEVYATITLQLVSETKWFITGGHGTWVTTQ